MGPSPPLPARLPTGSVPAREVETQYEGNVRGWGRLNRAIKGKCCPARGGRGWLAAGILGVAVLGTLALGLSALSYEKVKQHQHNVSKGVAKAATADLRVRIRFNTSVERNDFDEFCRTYPGKVECYDRWIDYDWTGRGEGARLMRYGYEGDFVYWTQSAARDARGLGAVLRDLALREEDTFPSAADTASRLAQLILPAKLGSEAQSAPSPPPPRKCYLLGEDASWHSCAREGEVCTPSAISPPRAPAASGGRSKKQAGLHRREGGDEAGRRRLVRFAYSPDSHGLYRLMTAEQPSSSFLCEPSAFMPRGGAAAARRASSSAGSTSSPAAAAATTVYVQELDMQVWDPVWVFPMHIWGRGGGERKDRGHWKNACRHSESGAPCPLPLSGTKIVRYTGKAAMPRGGRAGGGGHVSSGDLVLYKVVSGSFTCDASPVTGFGLFDTPASQAACYTWQGGRWDFCASDGEDCDLTRFFGEGATGDSALVRFQGDFGAVSRVVSRRGAARFACGSALFEAAGASAAAAASAATCEYLDLNVTEPVAQWIDADGYSRQISRAAYILSGGVANISLNTPLFEKPKPHVVSIITEDPVKAFGRKIARDFAPPSKDGGSSSRQQCSLNTQRISNVPGAFFRNPAKKSKDSCSAKPTGFSCCSVEFEGATEEEEMRALEEDLQALEKALTIYGQSRGGEKNASSSEEAALNHGRRLLSMEVDIPEDGDFDDNGVGSGKRRRRRRGWACGMDGMCGGVQFSDIGDIIGRLIKLIKGIPRWRVVKVPVKVMSRFSKWAGTKLFFQIPNMVQMYIYYQLSAYLANTLQLQGFQLIMMDVFAGLVSVIPYATLQTPLQAIKRRCDADKMTVKEAAEFIWRKYGLPGFLAGFGPEAFRQLAFMPLYSLIQGTIEYYTASQDSGQVYGTAVASISSAMAGGIAAFVAHPSDVVYDRVLKAEPARGHLIGSEVGRTSSPKERGIGAHKERGSVGEEWILLR
eukprot:jgi/Bigna1/79575/fgenesh1_pg.63_\